MCVVQGEPGVVFEHAEPLAGPVGGRVNNPQRVGPVFLGGIAPMDVEIDADRLWLLAHNLRGGEPQAFGRHSKLKEEAGRRRGDRYQSCQEVDRADVRRTAAPRRRLHGA